LTRGRRTKRRKEAESSREGKYDDDNDDDATNEVQRRVNATACETTRGEGIHPA
jgi:hypothetical protein